jgi:hypothetical protein
MDLRIKRIETHLTEEYDDDQSEDDESTTSTLQAESEIPRQSDGFVSNIHQPRAFNSRHDVMSTFLFVVKNCHILVPTSFSLAQHTIGQEH